MTIAASRDTRRSEHRATYTLELGVWHATCRGCGYSVSDSDRGRARVAYRQHIRATDQSDQGPVALPVQDELTETEQKG